LSSIREVAGGSADRFHPWSGSYLHLSSDQASVPSLSVLLSGKAVTGALLGVFPGEGRVWFLGRSDASATRHQ
jgi:hypothetical protein